jgi:hypothetical protein
MPDGHAGHPRRPIFALQGCALPRFGRIWLNVADLSPERRMFCCGEVLANRPPGIFTPHPAQGSSSYPATPNAGRITIFGEARPVGEERWFFPSAEEGTAIAERLKQTAPSAARLSAHVTRRHSSTPVRSKQSAPGAQPRRAILLQNTQ